MVEPRSADPSGLPLRFRLIVGLGNPGREYERTRHNIGFMILDQHARRHGVQFRYESSWRADVAAWDGVRLCKPQSFMNLSGEPVAAASRFYKIAPEETLVIFDDAALPLGKIRLREAGSAGGHNGMRSIIEKLGVTRIARLRVGIGGATADLTGHVLGRFSGDEMPVVMETVDRCVEVIDFAQENGFHAAMNKFN